VNNTGPKKGSIMK